MKNLLAAMLILLLVGCANKSSVNPQFSNAVYDVILLPHITGDTSNYVYHQLLAKFSALDNVHIVTFDEIQLKALQLGMTGSLKTASAATLQRLARELNAQAFFKGHVKSGAMSISDSSTIHSSIQLNLIDVKTGDIIFSSLAQESSASRFMLDSSSLEIATNKTISQYSNILSAF